MSNQGPNNGNTFADDASVGSLTWSSPSNAQTSNNSWAQATSSSIVPIYSHYLKATHFDFSIPAGSTINGVVVGVERRAVWSGIKDYIVKLVVDGSITGDNKATATDWPTSDAYENHGGSGDVWGATLDADKVNSDNFGVVIAVGFTDTTQSALIDHIRMTVYYSTPDNIIVAECRKPGSLIIR